MRGHGSVSDQLRRLDYTRPPRRNHPSKKGGKMTTTKPMQQDEEDDIEPQRVFTKTAQPQTEPSWAAIEAERLHRIERGGSTGCQG